MTSAERVNAAKRVIPTSRRLLPSPNFQVDLKLDSAGFEVLHPRDRPKKSLKSTRKRTLVELVQDAYGTSLSRACRLLQISRALYRYRSCRPGQEALRFRLRELAQSRPRYGYRRVHVLLRREGWMVNMKRVRRLYRLEGLQLRHRVRRRKHASLHRGIPPAATRAHERWSMDFVHDALMDGRAFRVLTVVDQWSRWSPILEVAQGMSGRTVAEALDRAIAEQTTYDHRGSRHGVYVSCAR